MKESINKKLSAMSANVDRCFGHKFLTRFCKTNIEFLLAFFLRKRKLDILANFIGRLLVRKKCANFFYHIIFVDK